MSSAEKRFDKYISLEERNEFLVSLVRDSDLIEITESVRACRDPDDDRILELAVNGAAAYIITGDSDLLVMNPFRGCRNPDTGPVPPLIRNLLVNEGKVVRACPLPVEKAGVLLGYFHAVDAGEEALGGLGQNLFLVEE